MESPNSTVIPIVTSTKLPWETPLLLPLDLAEGTEKNPYAIESSVASTAPRS